MNTPPIPSVVFISIIVKNNKDMLTTDATFLDMPNSITTKQKQIQQTIVLICIDREKSSNSCHWSTSIYATNKSNAHDHRFDIYDIPLSTRPNIGKHIITKDTITNTRNNLLEWFFLKKTINKARIEGIDEDIYK